MPELEDHKTDALFREGASRHDFDYEPEAWEQMKVLLDADNAKRRRWLVWYFGVGVLLIILLSIFSYQYWKKQGHPEAFITNEQLRSVDTSADDVPPTTKEIQSSTIPFNKVPPPQIAPAKAEQLVSAKDVQLLNKTELAETLTTKEADVQNRASDTRSRGHQEAVLPSDELLKIDSIDTKEAVTSLSVSPNQEPSLPLVMAINPLPLKGIPFLVYQTDVPEVGISSTDETEVQQKDVPFISIGISAGIVFGAVEDGGLGMDQPRFGAKIDYHLNNKFSVGTGAYLNQVCYRADGQDYKVEAGFWTDGIQAASVLAECNVLEIPLSLTLHPWGNDRSGLYASTGLTSYLMLEEEFTFDYTSPRDDLIKGWREENTNQHFLGIGHFNLGYQRKSGRKSSFQIETFIHLPLQGIGQGQVNLMTVGASVNYIFGFNK